MDEQRLQAYLQLIQQLLACPAGEEEKLLQAYADLVDADFAFIMDKEAKRLALTGNMNQAGWLWQEERKLAHRLGINSNSSTTEDTLHFFSRIFYVLYQPSVNSIEIYECWQNNMERINEDFLEITMIAFNILKQDTDQNLRTQVAATFIRLGDLMAQFPGGNPSLNLEIAISAYEKSLEIITCDFSPEAWCIIQNNLGSTYASRIKGVKCENQDLAITFFKNVLAIKSVNNLQGIHIAAKINLASVYSEKISTKKIEYQYKSIEIYLEIINILEAEDLSQDLIIAKMNLAMVYSEIFDSSRHQKRQKAIELLQDLLNLDVQDDLHELMPTIHNTLGNLYSDQGGELIAVNKYEANLFLDLAIDHYKKSLDYLEKARFPMLWSIVQNNLGLSYAQRFIDDGNGVMLAIDAYQKSLQIRTISAFPLDHRLTARNLGDLQSDLHNWSEAIDAYHTALVAAENLYQACTLLDSQAGELKATADLPRRAAYAYAKAGQLAKALETIERGRARGLSDRLQRDRADLAQLQQQRPDLFDRYRDITNQLQNLESQQRDQQIRDRQAITPEQHRNAAQALRQDLTEAIAQIRQVPGYETFLQAPSLTEIQQNLSTEAPTVYLIPTPNGSLALIATPQAITPLWLDDFPEAALTDLVQTWLNAYQNQNNDSPGWLDAIDQGTRQLWDKLMAPLIDRLKQHNHTQAILIPTGLLGLLPLHAAWTEDPSRPTGRRYALDELTFTYAPNAQSLVAARAIAQQFPDSHLDSILAIDNPHQDLPSSKREVMAAVKTFDSRTVLRHETATTATVAANLGQQAIVHFSCHGTANFNEPLNSGLLMSDDLLTLRELFNLKLTAGNKRGIRLAVLSACETGLPGLDLADEAIGLPVGLLQAGVAGAIASLWAVNDQSTMILLTKFYDLWRNDRLTPPVALRQAQQWLRNATNSEVAQLLRMRTDHPNNRDYSHPYYWAGFSYTGI